jgi:UDP:flavonoid glycosyltransferase YjiC (YdhE family)
MMRAALFTWEIGLGFGHIMPMLPVARKLKARGWRVVFALRDVREAGTMLKSEGFAVLQAPFHPDRLIPRHQPQPQSMADVLALFGFANERHLTGLYHAWEGILDLLKPDLLVASYAPLSLLCANQRSIPTLLLALPFELPPPKHPLPSFRNPAQAGDGVTDAKVIATVKRVLGKTAISAVHEIFKAGQTALLCFPELDFWGPRENAKALGALYSVDVGEEIEWLETGRRKVFAYLTAELPMLEQIRQDLSASCMEYLICLRGASASQLAQWQMPHIKTVSTPLKLGHALAQCDAVLSYGGMGMTSAALMAGKPSVFITRDLENYVTAGLVQKLDAGLHLNRHPGTSLAALLTRVIEQASFAKAAERFAASHQGHDPERLSTVILNRLLKLLQPEFNKVNQEQKPEMLLSQLN